MEQESFYIKKIAQRGKITIWLTDGSRIRRDVDEEFTNFGQHFRFPFIPENEFWIDQEAVPDERRFFIDHLLVEWRLMKKGLTYNAACEAANAKERAERTKTADLKRVIGKDGTPRSGSVHRRLLERLENGISIWLVDGKLVRGAFDIEFTEGGHDLVYDFVPKNEVWLDNDVVPEERPYVILHELYERSLMAKGLSYPMAHRKASRLEWKSRMDEKILKENLAKVGWKG